MARRGYRVGVIGATGAVGGELLRVLEERRFPALELRAFASPASVGAELEFHGEAVRVEPLDPSRVVACDLVFCAAPGALTELLPGLGSTRLVDVSGALELDPAVPLHPPGGAAPDASGPWRAVPRGAAAGLGAALAPLHREAEIERLTAVCLEPASEAGRRGVEELSAQTLELLNALTGEAPQSEVFPQPLAFDCLPLVGTPLDGGDSSEERRLAHVVRRLLAAPELIVEGTRVRAPVFGGTLVCVHLETARSLSASRARELWEKLPYLRVLDEPSLPSARSSVGTDEILIGRLRGGGEGDEALAFVLAVDGLRRGAALSAVEAADALLEALP